VKLCEELLLIAQFSMMHEKKQQVMMIAMAKSCKITMKPIENLSNNNFSQLS
jgi:hypothetical protein